MAADKKRKDNRKDAKPSFGKRVKKFFADIRAELKRVTWPDKKRLKGNTGIVLSIIVLSILMIFIFDTAISSLLNATGFYDYDKKPAAIEETLSTESESLEEVAETTDAE